MKIYLSLFILILTLCLTPHFSEAKQQVYKNDQGDVEYNATEDSPTLPLRQSVPPSNSPNTVYVGTPAYYYYPVPVGAAYGGYGYGGPGYGNGLGGSGVIYRQSGGKTTRSFWYNTPGSGGYGYRGGNGFYPYGGGGGIYLP